MFVLLCETEQMVSPAAGTAVLFSTTDRALVIGPGWSFGRAGGVLLALIHLLTLSFSLYHLKVRSASSQLCLLVANESMCTVRSSPWGAIWEGLAQRWRLGTCRGKRSRPPMCLF